MLLLLCAAYAAHAAVIVSSQLTSLPENLGALSQLDALSVHKNCLASLPQSLSRLRDLSRLSLYENGLEEVPPGFGELVGVQEL
jgi:Leucine-rich repeat (LRR) protein